MPDDRSRNRGSNANLAVPAKAGTPAAEPWSDKTNAETPRWSDKTPADASVWNDKTDPQSADRKPEWADKTAAEPVKAWGETTSPTGPWKEGTNTNPNTAPNRPEWAQVTDPKSGPAWVDTTDPSRQWSEPEKTELRPPAPMRSFSGEFRLACVSGPTVGQEFKLEGRELSIGRSSENPIRLPDHSVSRKHVVLKKREGEWWVADLKSGNGTLVNGQPIAGEVALRAGDVLTVGDSRLMMMDADKTRYNATAGADRTITGEDDPGATQPLSFVKRRAPTEPEPDTTQPLPPLTGPRATMTFSSPLRKGEPTAADSGSKRRVGDLPSRTRARRERDVLRQRRLRVFWAAGILSVILIPIFIAATVRLVHQRSEATAEEGSNHAQGARSEGMAALRAAKWEEAKAAFGRAKQLDPTMDVQDLIEQAERGNANSGWLDSAATSMGQGQLAKATEALSHISGDSGIREALRETRIQLSERARQRIAQARTAMEGGRNDEAVAILSDVIKALPENREAKSLREEALSRLRR